MVKSLVFSHANTLDSPPKEGFLVERQIFTHFCASTEYAVFSFCVLANSTSISAALNWLMAYLCHHHQQQQQYPQDTYISLPPLSLSHLPALYPILSPQNQNSLSPIRIYFFPTDTKIQYKPNFSHTLPGGSSVNVKDTASSFLTNIYGLNIYQTLGVCVCVGGGQDLQSNNGVKF